jgi:hypothetical protein
MARCQLRSAAAALIVWCSAFSRSPVIEARSALPAR